MKVVIPVGALHIGGGCRVLAEVANALAIAGHDPEVVIPEGMPIEYALHCKITTVPSLAKEYIPFGDIVLSNFYTTFQGPFEAWPNQCVRLSLGFEPLWVPNADYAISTYQHGVPTISISHWLDDQIFTYSHQRGYVVNLGIDRTVFHPKVQKTKCSRKIILYLARDTKAGYELKGYYDFVQAMRILKKHYSKKFMVYMICPERD
jgi:glycosyltransferase involved in cell wall biosynthesis